MNFDLSNPLVQDIGLALVIVVVLFAAVKVSQWLVSTYVKDATRVYHTRRLLSRIGGFVAVVLLAGLFSPRLGDLLTILTVIGAGLAIAIREALLNFAGGLYVTFASPYKQGDRIEVNGVRGDVIDIRLLRTTLMEVGGWVKADQSSGRITHIPNGWTLIHGIHNYNRGFRFIWNELSVVVTFRSDWEAARDIMQRFAEESAAIVEREATKEIRELSREYLVHYGILTPFVYVAIMDNGVRLTLRYLCEVRKRRGTEHALTLSILESFRAHGNVELAYPMTGLATLQGPQFGPNAREGAERKER